MHCKAESQCQKEEKEVLCMSFDEMISKLDEAYGRLFVAAMKYPVVREATI